ncbi:MAG: GFA family protein [Gammaproteobacteria bacterium]|nr:GFA family protein [Gammaproteobacteria bacterium]
MHLLGSCHCSAVKFELHSKHPYPFNLCYCSICRKTAGGGGFAINLSGDYNTLRVRGRKHLSVYRAAVRDPGHKRSRKSLAERHFCELCGSALWSWDPRWPDLVHPFASAIDSPLPTPPERTHLMLEFKANWVEICSGPQDRQFSHYPEESIADWHDRLDLSDTD